MHKLANIPSSNSADLRGNTNIKINISDSSDSANYRSRQPNSVREKVIVEQDVSDNDDVTTPFKNASDLSMTENESKSCN